MTPDLGKSGYIILSKRLDEFEAVAEGVTAFETVVARNGDRFFDVDLVVL